MRKYMKVGIHIQSVFCLPVRELAPCGVWREKKPVEKKGGGKWESIKCKPQAYLLLYAYVNFLHALQCAS